MDHLNSSESILGERGINYKKMLERIDCFMKHLHDLEKLLVDYNAKNLLVRDKNDDIAKCLIKYKHCETFETTTQYATQLAADILGKVGDHQTTAFLRMEKKVLPNLSTYKTICKCLKADLKSAIGAQSRVFSRKKLMKAFHEKSNENPHYRDVTSDAEKQYENALAEHSHLNILSQEQIIKFEHKRLMDLKESLEYFFKIEIAKHAKCLELLSEGYKYVHSIDENADLEILKKYLHLNQVALKKAPTEREKHKRDKSHQKTKKVVSESSDKSESGEEVLNSSWQTEEESEDEEIETDSGGKISRRRYSKTQISSRHTKKKVSKGDRQSTPPEAKNSRTTSNSAVNSVPIHKAGRSEKLVKASESFSTVPSDTKHRKVRTQRSVSEERIDIFENRHLHGRGQKTRETLPSRPTTSPPTTSVRKVTFNDQRQSEKLRQDRKQYLQHNAQYWQNRPECT